MIEAEILNEIRALDKLGKGNHPNIVRFLKHGRFATQPYYSIDMELCDLNLEKYIAEDFGSVESLSSGSLIRAPVDLCHLFGIMKDITSGLAFIHSQKEIHRDLKPVNGINALVAA